MRRLLALIMVCTFIVGLVGCGGGGSSTSGDESGQPAAGTMGAKYGDEEPAEEAAPAEGQ